MPLEAQRSRHVAVTISEVCVSCVITLSLRQQSAAQQGEFVGRAEHGFRLLHEGEYHGHAYSLPY
jgi:hypothetical protein